MLVLHILRDFWGRNLGSPVSANDLYFKCVNRMELVFLLFKPSNCASKDSSRKAWATPSGYTEATLERRDFDFWLAQMKGRRLTAHARLAC